MEKSSIEMWLLTRSKYFTDYDLLDVKRLLEEAPEDKQTRVEYLPLKDPIMSLILSFCLGSFGVDRFYVGDTGLGIIKLLTLGGCGIWTIIDYFLIMNRTKEKNMETFKSTLFF